MPEAADLTESFDPWWVPAHGANAQYAGVLAERATKLGGAADAANDG
ncbi:MAG: hypothetical protein IPK07_18885 [Deltaproteobacteria bacterium]|nr:hypothetical protein [Deltaproteobacteria bacterium]